MNTNIYTLLAIIPLLTLGACGGGGGSSSPPPSTAPSTGVFVDSTVVGLHYETPTHSGTTNSAGEFNYLPGEAVTFSIGGIVFGSATAGPIITPLSLVSGATDATDPVVTNIVRLLITLDDDGNPDNVITITTAVTNEAAGLTVDFTATDLTVDTGVITLLAAIPGTPTLVDETTAQDHFAKTLTTTWGSMKWGAGIWTAAAP